MSLTLRLALHKLNTLSVSFISLPLFSLIDTLKLLDKMFSILATILYGVPSTEQRPAI
jgi:hypothetical protein